MPRQNRRLPQDRTPRPVTSVGERRDDWRGEEYSVRMVTGAGSTGSVSAKMYRCPGCDQEIRGGAHLVVWPTHDLEASDRRHWHSACWAARDRRAPGVVRSRSAPRF